MEKIYILLLLFVPINALGQVRVKGYFKKDGTYVQPHTRTLPDGYKYNNYSSYGNANPYIGKKGTKDATSTPSYPNYNHSVPSKGNSTINRYSSSNSTCDFEKDASIVNDDYSLRINYFYKEGSEFYEIFSIKNNTSTSVNRIKIRLMYYVGTECIDYRDLDLAGTIPAGLSKKFEVRSFDQKQKFVYHKSTRLGSDYYTRFTVRMKPIQYFKCY